ncbi:para-aminobenzoate synthase, (PABA) [Lobaria immixta]|nr:para-aminobenzoate synthase, (PABA) [Lobaria immixta]
MAVEGPDPKTFKSWDEAFQYPVATVRAMERQLRSDIESNRERLRTLVGASYRDLLGTAESIIEMDGQMQQVETYVGNMGKRCNARLLEKKGSNLHTWDGQVGAADIERFSFASQFAILRSCAEVLSKLLRYGGSVLLAAKVLVISRLLHKKLSQRSMPPPYVDSVWNRLTSLRRKILSKIDSKLQSVEVTEETLIEAMCAFALATSSSPADVLRHFHHVRLEAMIQQGQDSLENGHSMLQALRIYTRTLKDTRTHFPGHLAKALQNLKSTPLFRGQDLRSLIEFNLEVHQQWIGDDIKMFTPYIRSDDLQKLETNRILKEWAEQAFRAFLGKLQVKLKSIDDSKVIMQLRTQIFQLWLSNSQHSVGIEVSEILDGFRNVFNARLAELIKAQTRSLEKFSVVIRETLQSGKSNSSDFCPSLWSSSMTSMEISNGGKSFIRTLLDGSQGRNEALRARSIEYTAWLHRIEAIEEIITSMRKIRWEEEIDETQVDEDLLEDKQILLSEDDPRLLESELRDALEKSFSALEDSIRDVLSEIEAPSHGQQAVYLIRIWREIRQHLPKRLQHVDLGRNSIIQLQQIAADAAISASLQAFQRQIEKVQGSIKVLGRPLWEGNPELPVLPSSWIFKLLHKLSVSMMALGSDIWCPQATDVLKARLRTELASQLETLRKPARQVNGSVPLEPNTLEDDSKDTDAAPIQGDNQESNLKDSNKDDKIQRIFDLLYLMQATTGKGKSFERNSLALMQQSIVDEIGLSESSTKRMNKAAEEYWKRTSLLFALLA